MNGNYRFISRTMNLNRRGEDVSFDLKVKWLDLQKFYHKFNYWVED